MAQNMRPWCCAFGRQSLIMTAISQCRAWGASCRCVCVHDLFYPLPLRRCLVGRCRLHSPILLPSKITKKSTLQSRISKTITLALRLRSEICARKLTIQRADRPFQMTTASGPGWEGGAGLHLLNLLLRILMAHHPRPWYRVAAAAELAAVAVAARLLLLRRLRSSK